VDGKVLNSRCFIRDDTAQQVQKIRAQLEAENALSSFKSKDKFLRRVLHEIRTPANLILQSLDADCNKDMERIKQMQKLVRIIHDMVATM
jgi:signal transduction histidine kinase